MEIRSDSSVLNNFNSEADSNILPRLISELGDLGNLLERLKSQSSRSVDGSTWSATASNNGVVSDPRAITENRRLIEYFSQNRANEMVAPALLSAFSYGSKPIFDPTIVTSGIKKEYIAAIVPTLPEVQQMREVGMANIFNAEWNAVLAQAIEANGGLGDSENGFLAFSKEHGFIRLRNPGLTPEQNRKLAEISLVGGFPVEELPSRKSGSVFTDTAANKAIEDVIERYEVGLHKFINNPDDGLSIKDGRRRFEIKIDPESGYAVSYSYKKSGGLKGLMQKAMPIIAPLADIVSVALPGLGTVVAQGVKMAGSMIASGKARLGQLVQYASGLIPGIGSVTSRIGSLATNAISSMGGYVGRMIDGGKVTFQDFADGLLSTIGGFEGFSKYTDLINRARQINRIVADGKIDLQDISEGLRMIER